MIRNCGNTSNAVGIEMLGRSEARKERRSPIAGRYSTVLGCRMPSLSITFRRQKTSKGSVWYLGTGSQKPRGRCSWRVGQALAESRHRPRSCVAGHTLTFITSDTINLDGEGPASGMKSSRVPRAWCEAAGTLELASSGTRRYPLSKATRHVQSASIASPPPKTRALEQQARIDWLCRPRRTRGNRTWKILIHYILSWVGFAAANNVSQAMLVGGSSSISGSSYQSPLILTNMGTLLV